MSCSMTYNLKLEADDVYLDHHRTKINISRPCVARSCFLKSEVEFSAADTVAVT